MSIDNRLLAELKGERSVGSSLLLFIVICIISVLLSWSYVTELDVVIRGEGKTVSQGQNQMVQTPESGTIKKSHIVEGQIVNAGDILFELNLIDLSGQEKQINERVKILGVKRKRLLAESKFEKFKPETGTDDTNSAFFDDERNLFESRFNQLEKSLNVLITRKEQRNSEIDELNTQYLSLGKSLALVKSEIASVEPLVKAGLAPETRLITLQRELEEMSGRMDAIPYSIERIQKAIQEIDQQVESEKQGYQTQALTELSQVNIEIEDLSARLPAIVERMKRQTVLSPISGVINRITYQSSDAFVRSGDVLTEIVPADDSLIVEGKIDPKDIAKIKQGDDVKISLTAYDPSKFGRVDGSIRTISADAISNPDTGEQYYSVDIEVSGNLVDKAGKTYPLLPGMVATIEILAGKRTILDYFWQPITKGKDAAFRE